MEGIKDSIGQFLSSGGGHGHYVSENTAFIEYGHGSYCGYSLDDYSGKGCVLYGGRGEGDDSGNGYGSGTLDDRDEVEGYYFGSGAGGIEGDGWGNGFEDACGISAINGQKVYYVHDFYPIPTLIYRVHLNQDCGYAMGAVLEEDDLSLTPCYIAKHKNRFGFGNTFHNAVRSALASWQREYHQKEIMAHNRIVVSEFVESHPQYIDGEQALYSLDDLSYWHYKLTGSCESGRLDFCKRHDFTEFDYFTIEEFLNFTKYAYGSDIIYDVAREYDLWI